MAEVPSNVVTQASWSVSSGRSFLLIAAIVKELSISQVVGVRRLPPVDLFLKTYFHTVCVYVLHVCRSRYRLDQSIRCPGVGLPGRGEFHVGAGRRSPARAVPSPLQPLSVGLLDISLLRFLSSLLIPHESPS